MIGVCALICIYLIFLLQYRVFVEMAEMHRAKDGQFLWALTKIEDYILIAVLMSLDRVAPAGDNRWDYIKKMYLQEGRLLHDKSLTFINRQLSRHSLPALVFDDGYGDSYTKLNSLDKSRERSKIVEQLSPLNNQQITSIIAEKLDEVCSQPRRDILCSITVSESACSNPPNDSEMRLTPSLLIHNLRSVLISRLATPLHSASLVLGACGGLSGDSIESMPLDFNAQTSAMQQLGQSTLSDMPAAQMPLPEAGAHQLSRAPEVKTPRPSGKRKYMLTEAGREARRQAGIRRREAGRMTVRR